MCNVQMRDRLRNEELRNRVDVECIIEVARRNRLRWYGHVERKSDGDGVKKCTKMEMNSKRKRGSPKITWTEGVDKDMKALGLLMIDMHDMKKWRELIIEGQANPR